MATLSYERIHGLSLKSARNLMCTYSSYKIDVGFNDRPSLQTHLYGHWSKWLEELG